MEIDPGGEHVAVPRQRQRGQVTAPATAPDADPRRVDLAARGEPFRPGQHVAIFRGAAARDLGRVAEGAAIAGAAAVIDREHVITLAGEVLVQDIGVGIIERLVEARQHLPARAAMDMDQRRMLARAAGVEQRGMDHHAVRGGEGDRLRRDEVGHRRRRAERRLGRAYRDDMRGMRRIGDERGERGAAKRRRVDEVCAAGQPLGLAAAERAAPQMTRVEIVGIGGIDDRATVGAEQVALDLEIARCQVARLAALRIDRPGVNPATALRREDQLVVGAPEQVAAARAVIAAADPLRCPVDDPRYAGRHVGDAQRPPGARVARRVGGRLDMADEGDLAAVRRKDRFGDVGEAGVDIMRLAGGGVDQRDEAVVAAVAGQQQLLAVGRPAEVGDGAGQRGETVGAAGLVPGPQFALAAIGDVVAIRREHGAMTFADL